jgi:hypothetical protein
MQPPSATTMPLRRLVEGTAGLVGILVDSERALALEACEDAEAAGGFAGAARQRDVDFAELQHLHALDEPRVACRTRRADRVMRPGDAEVHRHLSRRVVRHGARVVVVCPVADVVLELRNVVDLVLGLDVAVLGDADVDADTRAVHLVPIQPAGGDGFPSAVNRD